MKRAGDDRSSGTPFIFGGIFINEFPKFEKYPAVLFPITSHTIGTA
jgi:hypothetical protein